MGRNPEKNEMMKDDRMKQIFSSALKLFSTKGLSATKISDIAKEAGFSQGLIYHYYKSKNDIFIELINTAFSRLIHATLELQKMDLKPLEKIHFAFEELMKMYINDENASRYHLLIAIASSSEGIPEEAKKIIEDNYRKPYKVIQNIIEEGQKEGEIVRNDSKELSLIFWSTINGLAIYKAAHKESFIIPDIEIFLQMFKSKEEL